MKDPKKYIKDRIKVDPDTGCWEWQLRVNYKGYAEARWNNKSTGVHRISYQTFKGPIPQGEYVCHTCDNRKCVNPDHLWTGTQSDNISDMYSKSRGVDNKGTSNGQAKLNDESVLEIKKRLAKGELPKDLSPVFSVARTTISDILHNRTWTHVQLSQAQ